MTATSYENKVDILADVWTNYREEEAFADLFAYADISFPLAFMLKAGIVDTTERAEGFINEAFDILLDVVGIDDEGFDNLDELFASAKLED